MTNVPLDHPRSTAASPAWLSAGRIPSLDGLRGVSILMVIWSHVVYRQGNHWPSWMERSGAVGVIGVDVFFVISGFLITLLLLREHEQTGRTSLSGFYMRRFFRIVPAYVVYVAIVGTTLVACHASPSGLDWIKVATYTGSLFGVPSWYFGHTWSLSVEEHFYLAWPLLFARVRRRRLLLLGVALYSVVTIVLRAAMYKTGIDCGYWTPTRADAIAVGCCLALASRTRLLRAMLVRGWVADVWVTLAIAAIVLSVTLGFRPTRTWVFFHNFVYPVVIEWLLVIVVWGAACHSTGIYGRLLNWRPLATVGVLSYSLYLWQQPFFGPHDRIAALRLPWSAPLILLAATVSYFCVERPCLRLKVRFEPTPEARERSRLVAGKTTTAASDR